MPLLRQTSSLDAYKGMTAYAGDIHNHCGISYGQGSIEDAYANARLQLDFASVTGHASWHDMPDDPIQVHDYHSEGFRRLRSQWGHVQNVTESVHEDGVFVSLLSFEWHSMSYGDYCVYYKAGRGPLAPARARSLEALREALRELGKAHLDALVIPHHIGYRSDRRGVNWDSYTEEFSPVVEMISMHGCAEYDHAPRNYLHTMGPRDGRSTAQRGLELGHTFGFIGSTDHHSAHPGSHGYGRAMVWADELTREGVWEAIRARRTYAVTGDRIMLATSINGEPMGSEVEPSRIREIVVDVLGGDAVDCVELVRNNEVIARMLPSRSQEAIFDGMLSVSMGWGNVGVNVAWDVTLEVIGGRILEVEPRLHGFDVVAPSDTEPDTFSWSSWRQLDGRSVSFSSVTRGNPNVMTDATQQVALHVVGDERTILVGTFNGMEMRHSVAELLKGPRVGYLGGFLTAAMVMHRAVPRAARAVTLEMADAGSGRGGRDWYYARVRQHNDQYAWSSPTWVSAAPS